MQPITIMEMWKKQRVNSSSFIFGSESQYSIIRDKEYLSNYFSNIKKFDRLAMLKYADFCPFWNLQFEDGLEGIVEKFNTDAVTVILKNDYEYAKIWETLTADYNPLENYNSTETMQKQIDTGAQVSSSTQGAQTNSNSYGAQTNSNSYGAQTDTTQTSPFNDDNFANKDKMSRSAYTDNVTLGAKSDNISIGARNDSVNVGARLDSEQYTLKRNGNIGVTTNQQMAQSEIDLRALSMWDRILKDIIKELCYINDGGVSIC